MSNVVALGYLGLTGPLDEWKDFARTVLGLQEVASAGDDPVVDFRLDDRSWRISVEEGPGGLAYVGWEVNGPASLHELAERLDAAGHVVKWDAELARVRRVSELFSVEDPSGHKLELFYGAQVAANAFVSPTGARFVTGDLGLGHVVMSMSDWATSEAFYFDLLGFKLSDTIVYFGQKGLFTHCNPRHHSLAFFANPKMPPMLIHFMLQVEDIDMMGRAFDVAEARPDGIEASIGKHTNDHMVSFYMKTPSGAEVEYGVEGRLIDDATWVPALYDDVSFWGHTRTRPMGGG